MSYLVHSPHSLSDNDIAGEESLDMYWMTGRLSRFTEQCYDSSLCLLHEVVRYGPTIF